MFWYYTAHFLTNRILHFFSQLELSIEIQRRLFDSPSTLKVFIILRRYAPRIIRLTLQTSSRFVGIRLQLGSLSESLIKTVFVKTCEAPVRNASGISLPQRRLGLFVPQISVRSTSETWDSLIRLTLQIPRFFEPGIVRLANITALRL